MSTWTKIPDPLQKVLTFSLGLFQLLNVVNAQNIQYPLIENDTVNKTSGAILGNQIQIGDLYYFAETPSFSNSLTSSELLQGRISNVDIINAFGDPGRDFQIIIQGLNLSGNHQPYIVIDNIPLQQLDNEFNYLSANTGNIHPLIPVSVNDIQSIKVIKNPLSMLLYGDKGVDGAIIIETKKKGDSPIQINYQYSIGKIAKSRYPEMLDGMDYITLQLEAFSNAYGLTSVPQEIAYEQGFEDFYNYSQNTNWINAISQNGSLADHYLSLNGKRKRISYFTSIDFRDQNGTIINTGYRQFLNRTNFTIDLSRKISLGMQMNYAQNKYLGNYVVDDGYGNYRDVLEMAYIKAPTMSILEYDSEGQLTGNYFSPFSNYQGNGTYFYNPVAVSQLGRAENNLNNLSTSLHLKYQISKWIQFTEILNYDNISAQSYSYLPFIALINNLNYTDEHFSNDLTINSDRYRSETQFFLMAPFSENDKNSLSWNINLIYQYQDFMHRPKDPSIYFNNKNGLQHYATSNLLHYAFHKRYFVDVISRIESFSFHNEDKNWDHHFGGTVRWKFSEEHFLRNLQHLESGSLKLDLGFSNSNISSSYPYLLSNFSNTEQSILAYSIGLDLIFKNKLIVGTNYFHRKIEAQKFTLFFTEGWDIANNVLDISVTSFAINKKKFQLNLYWNGSFNRHTIVKTPYNTYEQKGFLANGEYIRRVVEGETPGSIYGLSYQGIFGDDEDALAKDRSGNALLDADGNSFPISFFSIIDFKGGDVKYFDSNFDGIIDNDDIQYLGNSFPKLIGGYGSEIQYRSFSISLNFHYRFGYNIINQFALSAEGMNTRNNQISTTINRWRYQGQDENLLHRAVMDYPNNSLASGHFHTARSTMQPWVAAGI